MQAESAVRAPATASAALVVSQQNARRFHLTSDLTDKVYNSRPSSGIQKPAKKFKSLRPPLATFVENQSERAGGRHPVQHAQPPHGAQHGRYRTDNATITIQQLPSSHKQQTAVTKTGHSMHDHPSTWDFESDQLADELAAFAMELDPGTNKDSETVKETSLHKIPQISNAPMMLNDDYVYETYVRVSYQDTELDPMMIGLRSQHWHTCH